MESKNNCFGLIECKDVLSFGIFNFTVICYDYVEIISFVLMQKNNYLCKKSKQIWNRKNKMLTEDVK